MSTDNCSSEVFSRSKLSLAVSAACAGVAPAAMAQEAEREGVRLEEIVVTATKREASLQDVPMAITAFTDADIVNEGFKQLDDYVAQIPGLSSARREPGGQNIIMRGCATSGVAFGASQSTSIYLDEQPITSAGFNPDPRLIDVARIEALSGPQGTLFGDSSQCGTLRIITNKPDATEFNGWVDLTAMSVTDGDTGYDISAMVNIPLADNRAALRFVGFRAEEPGYIDNVLTDSPGGVAIDENTGLPFSPGGTFDNSEFVKDDINERTVTGGRAALRIAPSDNWTLDLQAVYQETEADGFGDVDLPEEFHAGDNQLGEYKQARFGTEFWSDEWYQLSLTLEASLGIGELTVSASFMNRETFYEADSTAYLAAWQEFYPNKYYYAIYDFGGDPQARSFDDGESDQTSFEVRLATPSDSDSRWSGVIGAFYNESDSHTQFSANVRQMGEGPTGAFYYNNYSFGFVECPGGAYVYYGGYYVCSSYYEFTSNQVGNSTITPKWWDGVYNSDLQQMALFGEVTFDITEHFALTLGGRWFDIETDRTIENGTLIATNTPYDVQGPAISCDPTGSFTTNGTEITDQLCWTGVRNLGTSDESDFVPKVNLTYSPTDDNMFYATYSEGFRRGGGNAARPASLFGPGKPFSQFDSDLVKNYEIGTKNTFLGGRLQLNVTAYHMVWEDMQIEAEDPTPNIFTLGIVNLAEGELNGVETFLSWLPAERTSITANIGWNEAELAEDDILFEGTESELFVIGGARLPLTPDWKTSVSFDHEFARPIMGSTPSLGITYSYTGDSINSLGGISSTGVINEVRTQGSYSITNFRFGLNNESWSATLFIHNAFDEYAEQFYNDRWIQQRLTVNRPRTFGLNFRKNF